MKIMPFQPGRISSIVMLTLWLGLALASAQLGAPGGLGGTPRGPRLSGSMTKLFGENSAFTAAMEMQMKNDGGTEVMTVPGKVSFLDGKSRFEMELTKIQGNQLPAEAAGQVKALGMDTVVMLSRLDQKLAYMIYPGLQAYLENALDATELNGAPSDYQLALTALGEETLDGHACVKNQAVITDKDGQKHNAIVWNATDLKNFPIRIQQSEDGQAVTLHFRDVKLAKPEADQFQPPAGFKRYDNMMGLIQQVMMKQLGGGAAPQPTPSK